MAKASSHRDGLPALSPAYLRVMNVVWDEREASVADVWKTLSGRRRLARNTVQTMMARLEEKGWLRHRTAGNAFIYSATVPRGKTLGRMVRSLVDTAFRGSAEGLIAALLDGRGVSQEEAERITKMIDEARSKQ